MLGEQISEGRGKRGGRRVVSTEPQFRVEVSFEESTKVLGVEGLNIGTYVSMNKPDGSLYAEGQGVFASFTGDTVTWKAMGVGRLLPSGAVSYRGALSWSTESQKLASLNTMAGVYEFEVDVNGGTQSKIWEWK
jgi:hypothetical protein